jgi:hypothetical protein
VFAPVFDECARKGNGMSATPFPFNILSQWTIQLFFDMGFRFINRLADSLLAVTCELTYYPHGTSDRSAQRSFAHDDRGFSRCSLGDGRRGVGATARYSPQRKPA